MPGARTGGGGDMTGGDIVFEDVVWVDFAVGVCSAGFGGGGVGWGGDAGGGGSSETVESWWANFSREQTSSPSASASGAENDIGEVLCVGVRVCTHIHTHTYV
jgi:hypothetical protein